MKEGLHAVRNNIHLNVYFLISLLQTLHLHAIYLFLVIFLNRDIFNKLKYLIMRASVTYCCVLSVIFLLINFSDCLYEDGDNDTREFKWNYSKKLNRPENVTIFCDISILWIRKQSDISRLLFKYRNGVEGNFNNTFIVGVHGSFLSRFQPFDEFLKLDGSSEFLFPRFLNGIWVSLELIGSTLPSAIEDFCTYLTTRGQNITFM